MRVVQEFVEQSHQVQSRRYAADRPRQDVIEHQRRYGEFGQRGPHRLFDHAVHPAAHKHAATLDVNLADGIGHAHALQDAPGTAFSSASLATPPSPRTRICTIKKWYR